MRYTEFEILKFIDEIGLKVEIEKKIDPYTLQHLKVNKYIEEYFYVFPKNNKKYKLTKLGKAILEEYKRQEEL